MAPLIARPRGPWGFTLLEMILSIAIIASVAMLGSSLWIQSAETSSLAQSRERGLLLQRVGALLRDQWADRRALALPGEGEAEQRTGGVRFRPGLIGFTTARPILFTNAPLARVEYLVRERADGLLDLLYTEQRLLRFDAAPDDEERSEPPSVLAEEERRAAIVLLEGCEEIRMERFGPAQAPDEDAERDTDDGAEPEAEPEPERGGALVRSEWAGFAEDPDEQTEHRSDAVRIGVRYRGEEAVWVFVARPSR